MQQLTKRNIKVSHKAVSMIVDYLGVDLSKINNEIDKLLKAKNNPREILDIDIEKYIGISKEYNNFELRKAISEKNLNKAFQIADYFAKNPNSNPLVVTISMVFDFFSKLLLIILEIVIVQINRLKLISVNKIHNSSGIAVS